MYIHPYILPIDDIVIIIAFTNPSLYINILHILQTRYNPCNLNANRLICDRCYSIRLKAPFSIIPTQH